MKNEKKNKKFTIKEALLKAANYCAYQERCHDEVKQKLAEWGIYNDDTGGILLQLIEQNYLNEERFAKAFAGGKFRVKKWGRIKITLELKSKNISDYCIRSAMKEISDDAYLETLTKLAEEKYQSIQETNPLVKKNKTVIYLTGRGFEPEIAWDIMRKITGQ